LRQDVDINRPALAQRLGTASSTADWLPILLDNGAFGGDTESVEIDESNPSRNVA